MRLYGLEESEIFWEKKRDTKLLLAWNKHTIVVAFRGTASLANALADVQVTTSSIAVLLCMTHIEVLQCTDDFFATVQPYSQTPASRHH